MILIFLCFLSSLALPSITEAIRPSLGGVRHKVKVVSYNIQGGCTAPMDEGRYDLAGTINVLRRNSADVILLQEVSNTKTRKGSCTQDLREKQAKTIADALGMKYHYYAGLALLTKFEILNSENAVYADKKLSKKYRTKSRLKNKDDFEFIVFNTHLERWDAATRKKQLIELREIIHEPTEPVIVGGDLNECDPDVSSDYFGDFSTPISGHPTFTSAIPASAATITKLVNSSGCGIRPDNIQERLDYLFANTKFWASERGSIDSAAGTASDHFPIVGEFVSKDVPKSDAGTTLTPEEIKDTLVVPQPRINIPGLSFSGKDRLSVLSEDGDIYLSLPFLGEYISAVYRYAVIVGSILAVVMIIIAGIQWTVSGGNAEMITRARKRIGTALLGLMLLVISYTILYLVNPNLVSIRNIQLLYTKGIPLSEVVSLDFMTGDSSSTERRSGEAGPGGTSTKVDCKSTPSTPSGIGEHDFLGDLDCNTKKARKSLNDIKYIVLHESGSAKKTVRYWRSACRNGTKCVGSHYIIDRDGTIYQTMGELKIAIHTPGNWNNASIGIDLATNVPGDRPPHECMKCKKHGECWSFGKKTGPPERRRRRLKTRNTTDDVNKAKDSCIVTYTEAQYTALNLLINSIVSRTGVVKDSKHIRTHCNTAANHGDPRNFDWSKIGLSPYESDKTKCEFFPKHQNRLNPVADKIFK